MSDRVIILAGGASERWTKSGGTTPKHLLVVGGETLLARAARLAHEILLEPPVVVLPPDEVTAREYDARISTPHESEMAALREFTGHHDVGMYRATWHLWNQNGRTIYLYGDTYYTDDAMRLILEPRANAVGPWHMWARFGASKLTGKPWPEVWAHAFAGDPEAWERERVAVDDAARRWRECSAPRATIWEMHKYLAGQMLSPFTYEQKPSNLSTEIDDWTEDFDYQHDYQRFAERYAARHAGWDA